MPANDRRHDGNPKFPTPNPPLTTVTTALNDLEGATNDAQSARQEAKAKTAIQNDKDDTVDGLMSQLAGYVESVAGGDEAIIRSAVMDTKAPPSQPSDIPPAPANLNATAGESRWRSRSRLGGSVRREELRHRAKH